MEDSFLDLVMPGRARRTRGSRLLGTPSLLETTLFLLLAAAAHAAPGQQAPGLASLQGVLLERGTRRPLADVTVFIVQTGDEAITDKAGRFSFQGLRPGAVKLVVPSPDYQRMETSLSLQPGQAAQLKLYLEPRASEQELQVVVRGERLRREAFGEQMSAVEAARVAGTGGDPVKAVESMPGVSSAGASMMGVPVRGSSPEDSLILLDGHPIPMLFHFDSLRSAYNSALLEQVSLLTGGFGVEHGNATGGVVLLQTRAPRTDRWGGHVDLALLDASALAEGPITEEMAVALAFRRSLVDLFIPLMMENSEEFSLTTLPAYYDYQAKWQWRPGKGHTLSLDSYGGHDAMGMSMGTVDDADPLMATDFEMSISFHGAYATWQYAGERLRSRLGPSYRYMEQVVGTGGPHSIALRMHDLSLREDLELDLGRVHTLRAGARLNYMFGDLSADYFRPPKEGDITWSSTTQERVDVELDLRGLTARAYLEDVIRLDRLQLVAGLCLDWDDALGAPVLGPRASARLEMTDTLTLRAATGLYHRAPDPDERVEGFGTPDLGHERAAHVVAGLRWAPLAWLHAELQGYYKYLDDQVVGVAPTGDAPARIYDNLGHGQAFGGELQLELTPAQRLNLWASYSLSRSQRNDGPGSTFRLHDLDQTHNLILLGSWEFAHTWRVGLRFQYTSGAPFTPVGAGAFLADSGAYLPVYEALGKNSQRMPAFHRLDLRLDKRWTFDRWVLSAYLDIQNVYYHANPVGTGYSYDFAEHAHYRGLPILPSVGIRGEI